MMGARATYGVAEDGSGGIRNDTACSICGNPDWQGVWFGYDNRTNTRHINAVGEVFLCEACALDHMPALLADTLCRPGRCSFQAGAALFAKVRKRFWQAWRLACRSIRSKTAARREYERDLVAFHNHDPSERE